MMNNLKVLLPELVLNGLFLAFVLLSVSCEGLQPPNPSSVYDHLNFDDTKRPTEQWNRNAVIFSAYFTKDMDTQRNVTWKANDFSNIRPWYLSMDWHRLSGVIFHDGLDEDFIKRYTTDTIKFIEVKPDPLLSVHMYRFYLVLDYLEKHPEIEFAFLTDGSDVVIRNNPFLHLKENLLMVGSEPVTIDETWDWLRHQMMPLFNNDYARVQKWKTYAGDRILLNSGISGGHRDIYVEFLKEMKRVGLRSDANKQNIIDMAAFNVVLYSSEFEKRFRTGYPVHSVFKKYEIDRNDVYFCHK